MAEFVITVDESVRSEADREATAAREVINKMMSEAGILDVARAAIKAGIGPEEAFRRAVPVDAVSAVEVDGRPSILELMDREDADKTKQGTGDLTSLPTFDRPSTALELKKPSRTILRIGLLVGSTAVVASTVGYVAPQVAKALPFNTASASTKSQFHPNVLPEPPTPVEVVKPKTVVKADVSTQAPHANPEVPKVRVATKPKSEPKPVIKALQPIAPVQVAEAPIVVVQPPVTQAAPKPINHEIPIIVHPKFQRPAPRVVARPHVVTAKPMVKPVPHPVYPRFIQSYFGRPVVYNVINPDPTFVHRDISRMYGEYYQSITPNPHYALGEKVTFRDCPTNGVRVNVGDIGASLLKTLASIAAKYGLTVAKLNELNGGHATAVPGSCIRTQYAASQEYTIRPANSTGYRPTATPRTIPLR